MSDTAYEVHTGFIFKENDLDATKTDLFITKKLAYSTNKDPNPFISGQVQLLLNQGTSLFQIPSNSVEPTVGNINDEIVQTFDIQMPTDAGELPKNKKEGKEVTVIDYTKNLINVELHQGTSQTSDTAYVTDVYTLIFDCCSEQDMQDSLIIKYETYLMDLGVYQLTRKNEGYESNIIRNSHWGL